MRFSIGDRVTCIAGFDGNDDIIGKAGMIIDVHPDDTMELIYSVQFDEPIEMGHGGNGDVGKSGYCWCVPSDVIRVQTTWGSSKLKHHFLCR